MDTPVLSFQLCHLSQKGEISIPHTFFSIIKKSTLLLWQLVVSPKSHLESCFNQLEQGNTSFISAVSLLYNALIAETERSKLSSD